LSPSDLDLEELNKNLFITQEEIEIIKESNSPNSQFLRNLKNSKNLRNDKDLKNSNNLQNDKDLKISKTRKKINPSIGIITDSPEKNENEREESEEKEEREEKKEKEEEAEKEEEGQKKLNNDEDLLTNSPNHDNHDNPKNHGNQGKGLNDSLNTSFIDASIDKLGTEISLISSLTPLPTPNLNSNPNRVPFIPLPHTPKNLIHLKDTFKNDKLEKTLSGPNVSSTVNIKILDKGSITMEMFEKGLQNREKLKKPLKPVLGLWSLPVRNSNGRYIAGGNTHLGVIKNEELNNNPFF
jgi:hypothetical protein